MDFQQFLDQAWRDHAKDPRGVVQSFEKGIGLIQEPSQVPSLARLMTHVTGEHLGEWNEGISWLRKLESLSVTMESSENRNAIKRAIATLKLAGGMIHDLGDFGSSDQISILTVAAGALTEQKNPDKGKELFKQALELAQRGLSKEDPANRALAVAGHNLACSLEERQNRTKDEEDLMILAAQVSRTYWEIAGTWSEVSMAEYRLSNSYFQARQFDKSLEHAQSCIEICKEHKASALDRFYGYESLAQAEKARGNEVGLKQAVDHLKSCFQELTDQEKSWCESTIKKFTDLL